MWFYYFFMFNQNSAYEMRIRDWSSDVCSSDLKWRDGEQHFRYVLEALPAAIYTTDADGVITYYNAAAVELSGREPTLRHDKWCTTWRLHSTNGAPLPHDECPMAVALKEQRQVDRKSTRLNSSH